MRLVPCKIAEQEECGWRWHRKRIRPGIKTQIDENLKRVYQEALDEEVPDRFKQLLEQLREKESGK